jgi:hypothetical protein
MIFIDHGQTLYFKPNGFREWLPRQILATPYQHIERGATARIEGKFPTAFYRDDTIAVQLQLVCPGTPFRDLLDRQAFHRLDEPRDWPGFRHVPLLLLQTIVRGMAKLINLTAV